MHNKEFMVKVLLTYFVDHLGLINTLLWSVCVYVCFAPGAFPGGSVVKKSAHNSGDLGLIPGLGRSPGEGNGNLLQYSCLENSKGQRSLVGYSPWGRKESDVTELLTLTKYERERIDHNLRC